MAVKELDFYSLARPVQERFVAGTRAQAIPTPIAISRSSGANTLPWFIASGVSFVALVAFATFGFGDLDNDLAISSVAGLVTFVLLMALSAAALLRGLALDHSVRSLPYHAGNYLFPVGIIEARSARLRLHPLDDLDTVKVNGKVLGLRFRSGFGLEFEAPGEAEANQAKTLVQEAQKSLQRAEEGQSRRDLALLDPLVDNGFSNPFSPNAPYKRRTPAWAQAWLPLAIVLSVTLGYGAWRVRNVLSEERLLANAKSEDTVTAYKKYLLRGGTRDEVANVLLPRAELRQAQAVGNVEAIESYIDSHPHSKIADEVAAVLRSALLSELERVKVQGTLVAIRNLGTRFKNIAPIAKEIASAEHAYYENAFSEYQKVAAESTSKSDPVAFFRRLISYVEKHGPKVVLRWRRHLRESVRRADIQVGLSAYFMGRDSIPSQYFNSERSRRREQAATEKLLVGLQQRFPHEVLKFEAGPAFDDAEQTFSDVPTPLPTAEAPTLFITHVVEMTGGYMNPKPRGIFVGAGLLFNAVFQIPGDPEPLEFKFSMWRPPDLKLLKQGNLSTEAVYEDMIGAAFSGFTEKYLLSLFKPVE